MVLVTTVPEAGSRIRGAAGAALTHVQRKEVVLAAVIGLLLGRVAVILVGRVGLGAIETERIGSGRAVGRVQVGIVAEQARGRR